MKTKFAKDLTAGDKVEGRRVTWAARSRGFKMALDGHPDKLAIMAEFGNNDYHLYHPDEEVHVK